MKKQEKKCEFILYILCTILISLFGFNTVQSQRLCGGYTINRAELQRVLKFEKENFLKPQSTHYSIRIYFHICRNDDGTNAAVTTAQLATELSQLIADYAADNICFIQMGTDFVDNTQINTNLDPDVSTNVQWLNPYLVPNCINIFYHAQLLKYGGYAYNIPNTFFSITKGNIGFAHTISHEMGHCFGLFHTFEPGNGYENINGSNSTSTADLITDTRADPYAYKGKSCFAITNNIYTGTCTDPQGHTNFSPPYTNMMAYWSGTGSGYPDLYITNGQFTRINGYLALIQDLIDCESPQTFTLGPDKTYSSGYFISSAATTYTTTGAVTLNGSVTASLGGQLVDLKPGFGAYAYFGANIRITASDCNYTNKNLLVSNPPAQSANLQSSNNLIAYPNPTSSIAHLDFTTGKIEHAVILRVYNSTMQKVEELRLGDLVKGKQSIEVNLAKQPSGMYYVFVQLQDKKLTAKIALIK